MRDEDRFDEGGNEGRIYAPGGNKKRHWVAPGEEGSILHRTYHDEKSQIKGLCRESRLGKGKELEELRGLVRTQGAARGVSYKDSFVRGGRDSFLGEKNLTVARVGLSEPSRKREAAWEKGGVVEKGASNRQEYPRWRV